MNAVCRHSGKTALLGYALSCPLVTCASTAFAMSLQPLIDAGLSGDVRGLAARAAGEEGGQPIQLTYADDRVEIDRVSFAYGADRAPVLRDICLSRDLKKMYYFRILN